MFSSLLGAAGACTAGVTDYDQQQCPPIARFGLTILFEKSTIPCKTVDIVVLHGLNGHPQRTWTAGKPGKSCNFYWPWELRRYLDNVRVIMYGYNADISLGLEKNLASVKDLGLGFLSDIASLRHLSQASTRPLLFIAHSLGGLVLKQALLLAKRSSSPEHSAIFNATKSLVFFGSPHAGSSIDRKARVRLLLHVARSLTFSVPPTIGNALTLISNELALLQDDFRDLVAALQQEQREIIINTFYETRTIGYLGCRVVEPESALLGLPFEETEPLDANHQNIVRFTGFDDHIFRKVVAKLMLILSRINGNASAPNLESERDPPSPPNPGMDSPLAELTCVQQSSINCAAGTCQQNWDNTEDYLDAFAERLPSHSRSENSGLPLVIPLSFSRINPDQVSVSIRGLQRKCGIRMANEAPFDWSPLNIQVDIPRSTSIKSLMNKPPGLFYTELEDEVFIGLPELESYAEICEARILGIDTTLKDYYDQYKQNLKDDEQPIPVVVTTHPSEHSIDRGLRINFQDNLERYYQQIFPDRQRTLRQELQGDRITFDFLHISFMRTVRVPDGEKMNDLPAGLGRFPLFNVSDFADELPLDVVEKGGIFLPIYRHEAFWIAFERPYGYDKFAVRVYCGGVNGISGEPMVPNMATLLKARNNVSKKQDYIVVPPQPWLDGIAVEPGNVRQFVAVDAKSGRSVEEQIMGTETIGGLQLEVVPSWNYSCPRARFTTIDENGCRHVVYPGNDAPCSHCFLSPGQVVYMEHGRLSRTIGDLANELQTPHIEVVNTVAAPTTRWILVFVESLGKEYGFEVFGSIRLVDIVAKLVQCSGLRTEDRDLYHHNRMVDDCGLASILNFGRDVHESHWRFVWGSYPRKENELYTVHFQCRRDCSGPEVPPFAARIHPDDDANTVVSIICKEKQLEEARVHLDNGNQIGGTLRGYGIGPGSTITWSYVFRGGGNNGWQGGGPKGRMSVGAGGKIKQSIFPDKNPSDYWCESKAAILNVTFLTPSLFERVTEMACPPSPITMETYQEMGYPMFTFTDEVPSDIYGDFEKVKSVSQFEDLPGTEQKEQWGIEDIGIRLNCLYCKARDQKCILRPCNHNLCMTCELAMQELSQSSPGRSLTCPVCLKPVNLVVGKHVPLKRLRKGKERVPLPERTFTTHPVDDDRERFRSINFGKGGTSIRSERYRY